ncbi:hypothetical protein FQN50_005017 [Emmonsiellopsis sp. PD_5]|nr:hypothetical protein FQN50_005017 [Emmonsiellopsis sp. PD_5]
MLSGCSSSLLRHRGTSRVLRHSTKLLHVEPASHRFPRPYSLLRTILSKHVLSITDSIRPVVPVPSRAEISSSLAQPPQGTIPASATNSIPTTQQRTEYASPSTAENAVVIDEDEDESPAPSTTTTSTSTSSHPTEISNNVRLLMRHVPHPVAIITSTDPRAPSPTTAFRGMTVSSFNSVALYPEAVVSFNVKLPSETFNAIRTSSRFLVHLLAPAERTARLARDFARGNESVMGKGGFRFLSSRGEGGGGGDGDGNGDGLPVIPEGEPPRLSLTDAEAEAESDGNVINTPDFPFIFECQYLPQSVKIGNNAVVLGRVVNIIRASAKTADDLTDAAAHNPEQLCLTYADRRFWKMGENILLGGDVRWK